MAAVPRARDYFGPKGKSRLAGRAALVVAGVAPRRAAARAAEAGAAIVLLAGDDLPAGSLGLAPGIDVPVLSAPAELPAIVRSHAAAGVTTTLAIGAGSDEESSRAAAPAAFSSWGHAFGAHVKPDLVASGVALQTAIPGADEDGHSRFVTVSGTSVAAAVVAGVAARLAHARPALDAAGLRSALVATARSIRGAPLSAQGTGVVDGGRAAVTELVADSPSISFGRGAGDGWQGRRTLTLRNVSARALTVDAHVQTRGRGIVVRLEPTRLRIPPGRDARIRVTARVAGLANADVASGRIRIGPRGSQPLVVPWSVLLAPPPRDLIGDVELSERSFEPSDLTPAVLSVRLGTIKRVRGRDELQPVRRLDVYLAEDDGAVVGLLARLRDVLPGQYAFGLTGRGPDGNRLASGRYRLRLIAWPEAGGPPARRTVRFAVE